MILFFYFHLFFDCLMRYVCAGTYEVFYYFRVVIAIVRFKPNRFLSLSALKQPLWSLVHQLLSVWQWRTVKNNWVAQKLNFTLKMINRRRNVKTKRARQTLCIILLFNRSKSFVNEVFETCNITPASSILLDFSLRTWPCGVSTFLKS